MKNGNIVTEKSINDTKYNDILIQPEELTERVVYRVSNDDYETATYKYIYDIEHNKLYYDDVKGDFFTIKEDKSKSYINDEQYINKKVGDNGVKYKSVSVLWGSSDEYKKIYQVLNGQDKGKWYISSNSYGNEYNAISELNKELTTTEKGNLGLNNIEIYKDCSAISYYVEAYIFTNWVNDNLGGEIKQQQVIYNEAENTYSYENQILKNNIFSISKKNNPEDPNSPISQHKRQVMIDSINSNLNASISNYSRNGNGNYNFELPLLNDMDWNQVFSNISMITFIQGLPIGLKYYNNYAIATSTTNREYVDQNEIYFCIDGDKNFHRKSCEQSEISDILDITGYRNVEFTQKKYSDKYYYEHDNENESNNSSEISCYYCITNKANYSITKNQDLKTAYEEAYYEAIARERYYQKEKLSANFTPVQLDQLIWKTDYNPQYISTITVNDDSIEMIGNNGNYGTKIGKGYGKGAIWLRWNEDTQDIKEISFDYDVDFQDSFNAAGILLDIKETESQLSGYMISFNDTKARADYEGNSNDVAKKFNEQESLATLWKFKYNKNDNFNNINELEKISALDIKKTGKMKITINNDNKTYTINATDNKGNPISKTIEFNNKNTLGFFSDHHNHHCDNIRLFQNR